MAAADKDGQVGIQAIAKLIADEVQRVSEPLSSDTSAPLPIDRLPSRRKPITESENRTVS